MDDLELDKALADVRRAYRLLYGYQKRVLDLVKFIGDQFGYTYSGGCSKFSNTTPRSGSGNLGNWSWDWLNMYLYQFTFSNPASDDSYEFSVLLQSDSGFYDGDMGDKLNVQAFGEVELSATRLHLAVGKNLFSEEFFVNHSNYLKGNSDLLVFGEGELVTLVKSYPLTSFMNEDGALSQLEDFVSFCGQHNHSFRPDTFARHKQAKTTFP